MKFTATTPAAIGLVLEGLAKAEASVRIKYANGDEVVGVVADGGEYHGEPFLYLVPAENNDSWGVTIDLDRVLSLAVEV